MLSTTDGCMRAGVQAAESWRVTEGRDWAAEVRRKWLPDWSHGPEVSTFLIDCDAGGHSPDFAISNAAAGMWA
jgi:hypothetical protein